MVFTLLSSKIEQSVFIEIFHEIFIMVIFIRRFSLGLVIKDWFAFLGFLYFYLLLWLITFDFILKFSYWLFWLKFFNQLLGDIFVMCPNSHILHLYDDPSQNLMAAYHLICNCLYPITKKLITFPTINLLEVC